MTSTTNAARGADVLKPFGRVLFVCTPDENDAGSLRMAAGLAAEWKADLSILAVMEPPPGLDSVARVTDASIQELEDRMLARFTEEVTAWVERCLPELEPPVEVRVGKPFIEIIRYVVAGGFDLVFKEAESLPGLGPFLFASADQHLLRKCPCPVWLRLHDGPAAVKTVVAAVDVDATAADQPDTLSGVNRRILEAAARVVAGERGVVHVLHAWDAPAEGLVYTWAQAPDPAEAAKAYVNDVQSAHWRALDALVDQARHWIGPEAAERIEFRPRLERGVARTVIPEQVRRLEPDVLVMGTIARTGVPGFIIGNTAEDVLNSVDCSVLTVKPPGYVSPVPPP